MSLPIRLAASSDYIALCALWKKVDALHARLWPGLFKDPPGRPRPQHHLDRALQSTSEAILVAEAPDGQVVGMVHVKVYDTPSHCPLSVQRRRGHVEDIVVDESHRRTGVGRALMERSAAWCREQGASQLLLTVWAGNQEAEAFYRRLGYEPVSQVLGFDL